LASAALVLAACSGGDHDTSSSTTKPKTTTTAVPDGTALVDVALDTVEVAKLESPTAIATRPGTKDLYVTEKTGRVRRLEAEVGTAGSTLAPKYHTVAKPVLDLSGQVASDGEQGLLGLAFSGDGRQLYVFATLDPGGRSTLASYDLGEGTTANPSSRRELLSIDRKHPNHNGGQLAIGPDGFLYVGLGDGGGGGDPDGNGQDTSTLLGKILRIDPATGSADSEGDGEGPIYGVPAGNPFEAGGGRPEIWLYGVRNPWRFSFDRGNGDLWVADVGQEHWEEIDRLSAFEGRDAGRGANLGWDRMEGTHPFDGRADKGDTLPVFEYSHDDGCSITGGYVYRGEAIPKLDGAYMFADFCRPGIRAIIVDARGKVTDERSFDLPVEQVQSFGQDNEGELYLLLASGDVLRLVSSTPAGSPG
jgi:glucose/arabinose dehydrogenase